MLRLGGVAIHMLLTNDKIKYLIGTSNMFFNHRPLIPYNELVCDFLNSLSIILLSDVQAKQYPDVVSFAFWCRKANINKLKKEFDDKYIRLGLGVTFHISPSNVPINFAFSYAFSLLAGNANIVRVPSKDFSQTDIVCRSINNLFANEKYSRIAEMTAFVKYEQNNDITEAFSSQCNARLIWGGDNAIRNIRKLPIPERSIEIAFADRYSFCTIDGGSIIKANDEEMKRLANSFYNDTYLMDQNACSSPQLIIWLGEDDELIPAKQKFWNSLYEVVMSKYELEPVNVVNKYTHLCQNAIDLDNINDFVNYGNYIYRIELSELPHQVDALRGKCGYFYEYDTDDINSIASIVNNKYQTLTYFGVDKQLLANFVLSNRLNGVDRIVPIGSALEISVIWDGYDLIRILSRICDVK